MQPTHRPEHALEPASKSRLRWAASGWLLASLGACGSLLPAAAPPPAYFSLQPLAARPLTWAAPAGAPRLVVQAPRAAAGMDSTRIIYSRQPPQLEYFARSEWVDTPARMLAPLIVQTLQQRQAFAAVVQAPSAALGDWRLETQVLSLQQDFVSAPSRVRFVLSALLIDDASHRVLASRVFDTSATAARDDAAGGVTAAQQAVQQALDQLAEFCVAPARGWQSPPAPAPQRAQRPPRATP